MTLHYSTENSYHYGKHQHFLYNPSSNKPAALAAYLNSVNTCFLATPCHSPYV